MKELTGKDFASEVLNANERVLVDFYAPWCGPCKMIAPALDALSQEFSGTIKFVKVNVDEAPEIAMKYNVTGVPTLALFAQGQFQDQIVGMVSPASLRQWLESAAAPQLSVTE